MSVKIELCEVQEHEDCYQLWDGTDDWFLELKLTPHGWEFEERIWAYSPGEADETYFTRSISLSAIMRFRKRVVRS